MQVYQQDAIIRADIPTPSLVLECARHCVVRCGAAVFSAALEPITETVTMQNTRNRWLEQTRPEWCCAMHACLYGVLAFDAAEVSLDDSRVGVSWYPLQASAAAPRAAAAGSSTGASTADGNTP